MGVYVRLRGALDRGEWIATDRKEYLHLAVDLAGDMTRLEVAWREQRRRITASSLCDGAGLARAFEAALRQMWRNWLFATAPARP